MKGKVVKQTADNAINQLIKSIVSKTLEDGTEIEEDGTEIVTKSEFNGMVSELTKTLTNSFKGMFDEFGSKFTKLTETVDLFGKDVEKIKTDLITKTVDTETVDTKTVDTKTVDTKVDDTEKTSFTKEALDKLVNDAVGKQFEELTKNVNGENIRKSIISLDENGVLNDNGARQIDLNTITNDEWQLLPESTRKQLTKSVYKSILS